MYTVDTQTRVAAVNGLAARWARDLLDGRSLALSAPALWPMLALLAAGSADQIRADLTKATGVDAADAAAAARDLLELLNATPQVAAAVGIFSHRELVLDPFWLDELPPHSHGTLTGEPATDKSTVDEWVKDRTGGLFPGLPRGPHEETRLMLIGTLLVQIAWRHTMDVASFTPTSGPWADGTRRRGLRAPVDPADIAMLASTAGPLTKVIVRSTGEVDVHLVLGEPDRGAGEVIGAAVDTLTDTPLWTAAERSVPDSAAVRVGRIRSVTDDPRYQVTAPPFVVMTAHDLLSRRALFGLPAPHGEAAQTDNHLAGASAPALHVDEASQYVLAQFNQRGFTAAAVSATNWVAAGGYTAERDEALLTEVVFDRPYGFVAVHRPTNLALIAGWINAPDK
jgi:serine protease inhibitor